LDQAILFAQEFLPRLEARSSISDQRWADELATVQDLRHPCASWTIQAGGSLPGIQ